MKEGGTLITPAERQKEDDGRRMDQGLQNKRTFPFSSQVSSRDAGNSAES